MEQPCKGETKEYLIELFSQRVFYYVHTYKGDCIMKPCVLSRKGNWFLSTPYVIFFDENMELEPYGRCVRWEELFDGWIEANARVKHIEKLYNNCFWRRPYVTIETLEKYKGEMVRIEKKINEGLKEYPNFLGIDFCDVGANGIQVSGHHKDINNHVYGDQLTIKYDFTNKNEVIDEFINMWKSLDTPDEVQKYKDFLDLGNKYGWD